jgi:Lar family restriction alleviation protein
MPDKDKPVTAQEAVELKPCPFCGSEPVIEVISPHGHILAAWMPDYPGGAFIECPECGAGMSGDTRQEIVDKWNRRVPGAPHA